MPYPRVIRRSLLLGVAVAATMAAAVPNLAHAAATDSTSAAIERGTSATLRAAGGRWFVVGANMPWIRYGCDFGCGAKGGASGNELRLRRTFSQLSRHGVRSVRWFAFPGSAWQLGRSGANAGKLRRGVYADFDAVVRMAAEYDVYLTFVLFSDLRSLPDSWLSSGAGQNSVARSLRPLIRKYRRKQHVLRWEVVHEPDRAVDAGAVSLGDSRNFIQRIVRMIHANSNQTATVTADRLSNTQRWRNLGLDYFGVTWMGSPRGGEDCVLCRSYKSVASSYGLDRPVIVTGLPLTSGRQGRSRMVTLRKKGYAGGYGWSYRRGKSPGSTVRPRLSLGALRSVAYSTSNAGPRSQPLNPCFGPKRGRLLCPDIHMARPFGIHAQRRGRRTILRAGNSLDNIGRGPIEVHGRRTSAYWMKARQQIWRKGGSKLRMPYRGKLHFKRIPGQYRYWKFDNAARFELWSLDGAGRPKKLVRVGPKAIYCLRDLQRRHGGLRGAPRGRYYPGCSQRLGQRAVTLGTSVGWSDVYPSTYHEQWIDVTGLRGCFAYTHIADPKNHIFESNEDNNRTTVVVKLPYNGRAGRCARFGKRANQGPVVGTY